MALDTAALPTLTQQAQSGVPAEKPHYTDMQWAIARKFYPNTDNPALSIEIARREDPAAVQRAAREVFNAPTPLQKSSPLAVLNPFRVVSGTPAPVAQLPTIASTPTEAPIPEPTPAPVAAPEAAKPVAAPRFLPTLSSPNTAQQMVSEGRNLMNTQGIGGFVQAKGLNRMAQTINQTNEPLIIGQYGLQREALTANERLEQAKLVQQQHQQNLETWTPDKDMMGNLIGYGRTKGGVPQYVTKESLMAKPTLAQFVAKAGPLNPKLDQAALVEKYKALYPD